LLLKLFLVVDQVQNQRDRGLLTDPALIFVDSLLFNVWLLLHSVVVGIEIVNLVLVVVFVIVVLVSFVRTETQLLLEDLPLVGLLFM
jgi:hypothetical protein